MGKDHPDWGGVYNDAQFYPLFDQAELAARLGSPLVYDRRGALLWYYDFAHGIGDLAESLLYDSTLVLDADTWERPPFSIQPATGPAAYSVLTLHRLLAIPQLTLVGVQASVKIGSNVGDLSLGMIHYDGSAYYLGQANIDINDLDLEIVDDDAGVVDIDPDIPDLATASYFAHLKVVCDLETHKYVRVNLDNVEYDVSAYTMSEVESDDAPHLRVRVRLSNDGGGAANVWLDNIIVTAAEPPN